MRIEIKYGNRLATAEIDSPLSYLTVGKKEQETLKQLAMEQAALEAFRTVLREHDMSLELTMTVRIV